MKYLHTYKEQSNLCNESNEINLKIKFTEEQINNILSEDDLDIAIYNLQDKLNIKTGDIAGIFFSKYDNANEYWKNANKKERKEIIIEYLELEEKNN